MAPSVERKMFRAKGIYTYRSERAARARILISSGINSRAAICDAVHSAHRYHLFTCLPPFFASPSHPIAPPAEQRSTLPRTSQRFNELFAHVASEIEESRNAASRCAKRIASAGLLVCQQQRETSVVLHRAAASPSTAAAAFHSKPCF